MHSRLHLKLTAPRQRKLQSISSPASPQINQRPHHTGPATGVKYQNPRDCLRVESALRVFMQPNFRIRPAIEADLPVLRALIEASVRQLQAEDYTSSQRESALATVFGVDTQLITDGTYFVVEYCPAESQVPPVIIACGGWSKRKTLYGADQWTDRHDELLDPRNDAAKIRAFFIHPDWARRGIGTLLLDACENSAKSAGFSRFEMGATLTGAKLFRTRGYASVRNLEVPLRNGESLPIIQMEKRV
jgi:GNAT superfamily N-acetyltransferase